MPPRKTTARQFARYERRLKRWFPVLEKVAPAIAKRLGAKIFFTPIHFKPPPEEAAIAAEGKMFWFTWQKHTIRGYEWGKGPVVIFMHGWSGRGLQVREFVQPLVATGYRVIAFDAPAHGKSSGRTSDITSFCDSLTKLIKIKGPVYALIGHSLGGAACIYALKHYVSVQKLVVISTPAVAPDIKSDFLRRIGGTDKTGDYLEMYIHKRYGRTLQEFSAQYSAQGLKNIPTLLIYDEDDTDVPLYHGEELKRVLTHAEIVVTHKLGHTKILRDPDVVNTVVRFLAS